LKQQELCEIDCSDDKRCYITGLVIKFKCPKCGKELQYDVRDNYLSWPESNQDIFFYVYCSHCDSDIKLPVKINQTQILLEYDTVDVRVV
jgi:hypothetical protein